MKTVDLLLSILAFAPTLVGEVNDIIEALRRTGRLTDEEAAAARAEKERIMRSDPAWQPEIEPPHHDP